MKLIGLIGGVSPESTLIYCRHLNDEARRRLGGEHCANFVLWHLDYGVMIDHYHARNWQAFTAQVTTAGDCLKLAGADALVICSNTTHIAADALAAQTGLPVLHLQDALAAAMTAKKVRRPLLLGTPVVMGESHYRTELAKRYDGAVVVPDAEEQVEIGRIILDELCHGRVDDVSRSTLLSIIARHEAAGADGVILGCTELCMILEQAHCDIAVFDTTGLHAAAAMRFAFGDEAS